MKWVSPEQCQSLKGTATLIDVREPWEVAACSMEAMTIPMHAIPAEAPKLDKDQAYVIVCKTGRRAEAVANFLESEYGFTNVSVMEGGVTAWYALVQPTFELY